MYIHSLLRAGALAAAVAALPAAASGQFPYEGRICDQTDEANGGDGTEAYFAATWPEWLPPSPTAGYCKVPFPVQPNTIEILFRRDDPVEATVVCEAVGNCTYTCTAYPHGDSLGYQWSGTGSIALDPATVRNDNFAVARTVNDGDGAISLTLTTPAGLSSVATWPVPAGSCGAFEPQRAARTR